MIIKEMLIMLTVASVPGLQRIPAALPCSRAGPRLPPGLRGAEPTQRFLCEPRSGPSRKREPLVP